MMAAMQLESSVRARGPRPSRSRAAAIISEGSGINPELFSKFQGLIYQEAGIWLASHKTALLTGRLARRLRLLGLSNMHEYYRLVTQPDQQHERAIMIDCITTNETHFFREPRHFELLAHQVFPRWKEQAAAGARPKHLRIWSAGCSTGEEPYSLAMMLLKYFPKELGWDLEILATDISTGVLEKARAAIFPLDKSKEIPQDYLHDHMLKGVADQEGTMKASPDLQRLQNEGYELEIRSGFLLVKSVPYVNTRKEVKRGTLVAKLVLAGDKTMLKLWFQHVALSRSGAGYIGAVAMGVHAA